MKTEDDKLIALYLLGELSDEEKDRFEERFFADDSLFHEIETSRDELIEGYVRNTLSDHERKRFDKYFLASPGRRKRVETTRSLIELSRRLAVEDVAPPASVVVPFRSKIMLSRAWLAAAALVIIAIGVVLVVQSIRLQNRIEQLESERAALEGKETELRQQLSDREASEQKLADQLQALQAERQRLEQELEGLTKGREFPTGDQSLASLTLSPVLVREDSKTPLLKIAPGTRQVRIRMNFDAPGYDAYRATLETVEGRRVWRGAGLKALGSTVTLYMPASQFASGDFLLTLSGVKGREAEEVGKYYFRVVN